MKKLSKEEFIKQAKLVHGDKYDYSKVEYINKRTKVCIICPEHGEFWQVASSHVNGAGCPYCAGNKKLTTDEFIKQAKLVHGDKYDYSKVEYINAHTKVCIICPEHGEFYQTPQSHIHGNGCYKCNELRVYDLSDFLKKANKIHGDKYDYSKVEYINSTTKICIICPEHGEFWQVPYYHLNGNGCDKCGRISLWDKRGRITTEDFVKKAKEVHGDKYDYSETDYKNKRTKVKIICHKKYKNGIEHGIFEQTPGSHLKGNGCPHCRNSHLENVIHKELIKNNIKFEKEKTFEWLTNNGHLYLDYFLPEFNVAIECQGIQHFMPLYCNIKNYDAENNFKIIERNDSIKKKKCEENGIKILYFTDECIYKKYKHENMFYNFNELKNNI